MFKTPNLTSESQTIAIAELNVEGMVSTEKSVTIPYSLLLQNPLPGIANNTSDKKLHVAFVIDKSGSMKGTRNGPTAQAMHNVASSIHPLGFTSSVQREDYQSTFQSSSTSSQSVAATVLDHNPPEPAPAAPIELAKQVGTDMITDLLNMRHTVQGFTLAEFSNPRLADVQSVDLDKPDFFQQLAILNAHVLDIFASGQTYLIPALEKMRTSFEKQNIPAGTHIILFVATDGALTAPVSDIPIAIKNTLDPDGLYTFTVHHFRIGHARFHGENESAYFSQLTTPEQLHFNPISNFHEIPSLVLNAWAKEMDAPLHRMRVDVQFLNRVGGIICQDTAHPGCLPYGVLYNSSISLKTKDFQTANRVRFRVLLGDQELLIKTYTSDELHALEIEDPDNRADAILASTIRKFWAALVDPTLKIDNALQLRLTKLASKMMAELPANCSQEKKAQMEKLAEVLNQYQEYMQADPTSDMGQTFNSVISQCGTAMSSQMPDSYIYTPVGTSPTANPPTQTTQTSTGGVRFFSSVGDEQNIEESDQKRRKYNPNTSK